MRIEEVAKREAELMRLYSMAKEASDDFSDACKQVAALAETTPKVVRTYVTAMVSEKVNTVIAETEQLVMLFNAMPTVQTQVAA